MISERPEPCCVLDIECQRARGRLDHTITQLCRNVSIVNANTLLLEAHNVHYTTLLALPTHTSISITMDKVLEGLPADPTKVLKHVEVEHDASKPVIEAGK